MRSVRNDPCVLAFARAAGPAVANRNLHIASWCKETRYGEFFFSSVPATIAPFDAEPFEVPFPVLQGFTVKERDKSGFALLALRRIVLGPCSPATYLDQAAECQPY